MQPVERLTIFYPTDNDKKTLKDKFEEQTTNDLFPGLGEALGGYAILLDKTVLLKVQRIITLSFSEMGVEPEMVTIEYTKHP